MPFKHTFNQNISEITFERQVFIRLIFHMSLLVLLCVCQVCSLLHGSAQGLDPAPQWLKEKCVSLCTSGRLPGVSLYLCHGVLAMLSWKGALPGPQWEQLLLLVPNTLLDLDVR